jgi:4-amino-4-deoxy-L-arabinose transferase-like glycosyltransferase
MSAGSAALASVRVPAERRFRVAACALAVVAGLHGLVYVSFAGHRVGDTASYVVAAKAILHGSYSTPLPRVDVTGLKIRASAVGSPERQTYRTPGYPLLLAATGGGGPGAPTDAIIAVQALLMGLTTFVLIFVFRRLWSDWLALIAGAVTALDPFTKHYVTRILSEVLAGFLVAVTAYAFVRAWQERSARWWAATGAAAAALTLTRPLFALAIPLLALAALPRPRLLAALLAGSLLLLAPWLGWTAAATGRPALSSFGEGWNLLLAAHGEGLHHTAVQVERSASYQRDFDSVHRLAPTAQDLRADPDAHPRYLVMADAEQRRLATNLYLDRLKHEPWQVAWEVLYRSYFLWEAHEDWVQPGWLLPFLRALDWVTLALAVAGGWLAIRTGGAARALAIFLLVFTFVNGVHHVEARYAMPVRGLYLGFATLALFQLWTRHSPRTGRNTPARTIGGVT